MKLPPLNALKAFEASARTGSFTLAASELGVTSAAVSLQVRNLEQYFEKQLFVRSNNRISLTDAGLTVQHEASLAFDRIAALTSRLQPGRATVPLCISTLASLAERWLVSRLATYAEKQQALTVQIRIEDDPVDFSRHVIDVRITYGDHYYPGYPSLPLFQDDIVALASPALVSTDCSLATAAALPDERLIHVDWGDGFAPHLDWRDWYRAIGLTRLPDASKGYQVDNSSLAIAMATQGLGMTLAQYSLAEPELRAGKLVMPVPTRLSLPRAYCAISARPTCQDMRLQRFLDWLRT